MHERYQVYRCYNRSVGNGRRDVPCLQAIIQSRQAFTYKVPCKFQHYTLPALKQTQAVSRWTSGTVHTTQSAFQLLRLGGSVTYVESDPQAKRQRLIGQTAGLFVPVVISSRHVTSPDYSNRRIITMESVYKTFWYNTNNFFWNIHNEETSCRTVRVDTDRQHY